MNDSRIYVTGMGVVSPIGIGLNDFWNALRNGVCGITPDPKLNGAVVPWKISARLDDFDGRQFVKPRKALKVMCREIQFGYVAATMALEQATGQPLPDHCFDPDRLGCVFGAETFQAEPEELISAFQTVMSSGEVTSLSWGRTALPQIQPLWMLKYLPNMAASHISIALDARGPNNSVCQGNSSSAFAIVEGANIIRRGWADAMIAGGTSSRISPVSMAYRGPSNISCEHQEPAHSLRAFEEGRCGTVHAEGAAALTLESAESVQKRGAVPLAELVGYCRRFCDFSDSNFVDSLADAALQACDMAGIKFSHLGHVNLNGTGTIEEDLKEAQALSKLGCTVPLVAFKRNIGHPGPSATAQEIVGSILSVQHGWLPGVPGGQLGKVLFDLKLNRDGASLTSRSFLKLVFSETGQIVALVFNV
ncbi:MAG: hypothetical protein KF851_01510 [Pirellulaceae bacterium]|jgi:3-oxoacyl-[acyl-carrier-protein] synthase II|nr:hypothetical protein [Pirellulaceae bacterium]